jgi:hypothetical protein
LLLHPLKGEAVVAVEETPALGAVVVAEENEGGIVGFGSVGEALEKGVVVEEEVGGCGLGRG